MTSIYQRIPGYCRRGLHEMTEANTKVNSKGWKICRACRSAAQKRDTQNHQERRRTYLKDWNGRNKDRVLANKKASYERIRAAIDAAKLGKPCQDCGQTFPPYVMDFDHVPERGVKKFNVGLAKNLRQLAAEIAKCDLVCANCHRIRTHGGSRS